MLRTWLKAGQIAVLALGVSTTGGCLAAAAAGAGAGAGIYLTSQGAESMVPASPSTVVARVPGVLSSMGITVTEHKMDGDEHEWNGKRGDLDVHVQVKAETTNSARVTATARKNMAEYDKDYAQQIVTRITNAAT